MRLAGFALALASIAVLSLACANVRVRTDYDDARSTSRRSRPTPGSIRRCAKKGTEGAADGGDPFLRNTLLDKRVRDAVEAEFVAARGFPAGPATASSRTSRSATRSSRDR